MMHKLLLLYSWFIRIILFCFPDIPLIMRIRGFLYSFFMLKKGKNFQVAHNVIINSLEHISIGDDIYIAPNCFIIGGSKISINSTVQIGPGCVLSSTNHQFDFKKKSFIKDRKEKGTLVIDCGVWIGANCTITAGSFIPQGSVVGANSMVNKKFENEQSIYGGVPAKFIKKLENDN